MGVASMDSGGAGRDAGVTAELRGTPGCGGRAGTNGAGVRHSPSLPTLGAPPGRATAKQGGGRECPGPRVCPSAGAGTSRRQRSFFSKSESARALVHEVRPFQETSSSYPHRGSCG